MRAVPVYPVMGNHDYQGVARRDENVPCLDGAAFVLRRRR
jgi:hypothetical protein